MLTETGRENRRSRWDLMAAPARFLSRRYGDRKQNAKPAAPVRRSRTHRAMTWDEVAPRLIVEISLQLFQDSMQRKPDPVRSVLLVVLNFYQSLFKRISVQQSPNF